MKAHQKLYLLEDSDIQKVNEMAKEDNRSDSSALRQLIRNAYDKWIHLKKIEEKEEPQSDSTPQHKAQPLTNTDQPTPEELAGN